MGVDGEVRRDGRQDRRRTGLVLAGGPGAANGRAVDFGCGRTVEVIDGNGRTGTDVGRGTDADDVRINFCAAIGLDGSAGLAEDAALVDEGSSRKVIVDDADTGTDSGTHRSGGDGCRGTDEGRMMIMQGADAEAVVGAGNMVDDGFGRAVQLGGCDGGGCRGGNRTAAGDGKAVGVGHDVRLLVGCDVDGTAVDGLVLAVFRIGNVTGEFRLGRAAEAERIGGTGYADTGRTANAD